MTKNIEDLLYRGDNLERMGEMSGRLREDSQKYRRAAVRINWELLLKQVRVPLRILDGTRNIDFLHSMVLLALSVSLFLFCSGGGFSRQIAHHDNDTPLFSISLFAIPRDGKRRTCTLTCPLYSHQEIAPLKTCQEQHVVYFVTCRFCLDIGPISLRHKRRSFRLQASSGMGRSGFKDSALVCFDINGG